MILMKEHGKIKQSLKKSKRNYFLISIYCKKKFFVNFLSTKSEQELQMAKRPLSAYGLNRAMTNFSKNAAQTLNPRFQVSF